jgi:hypothetical protein
MIDAALFIRTFRGDRDWIRYSLRSLRKFATGFREIVLVMPREDLIHFSSHDVEGARVEFCENDQCRGYIAQQITKIYADEYTKAEHIVFTDSDTIATGLVTPQMFFHEGRPIQLYREWENVGQAVCWKEPTKAALGIYPEYEHMACLPLVYHRSTLRICRDMIEAAHGGVARSYIMGCEVFSEFNALGTTALAEQRHMYDWRVADPAIDGYPRIMKQHFSHDGVPRHAEAMEEILK